jgi:hypothetical protein
MRVRSSALSVLVLLGVTSPAAAATVRVPLPAPGGVEIGVVVTDKPPAGSKRPSRVLRVANAARVSNGVAVFASPAPACSAATRSRFTAVVVVVRRKPDRGGPAVVLSGAGKRGRIQRCGSYPLLAKLGAAGIPRLRCDRLTRLPPRAAQLLGSDATCIGAVQREVAMPSPYQLPLSMDLGTGLAPGPPQSRNFTGPARLVEEPSPGVFRYAFAIVNRTPGRYRGVSGSALDQMPDSLTFAAEGGEESPNVVSGPLELAGFQCRKELSPGLPGSLTCRAPRGAAVPAQLDLAIDFDNRLAPGPSTGLQISLPRFEGGITTYPVDVMG